MQANVPNRLGRVADIWKDVLTKLNLIGDEGGIRNDGVGEILYQWHYALHALISAMQQEGRMYTISIWGKHKLDYLQKANSFLHPSPTHNK